MNIPSSEMKILIRILITSIRHGMLRLLNYLESWMKGELPDELK